MVRRVLLAGALMLLVGAVQAPDEHANARLFADAFARFYAAEAALPDLIDEPEQMQACVARVHRRIAEHRWDDLLAFPSFDDYDRPQARQLAPLLMRLSTELHAVPTEDPALRDGRTALRRLRRAYAAVAALPPIDVCAEVRRWVRGGFEPTPALRRIRRVQEAIERVTESADLERRADRMEERMRELGAPLVVIESEGGEQRARGPETPVD
jgi:hypothetical protein